MKAAFAMDPLDSSPKMYPESEMTMPSGAMPRIVGAKGRETTVDPLHAPEKIILIDRDGKRLELAKRFGATWVVNIPGSRAIVMVMKMTGSRGVDIVVEAFGMPGTYELCREILASGGTIVKLWVTRKPLDRRSETRRSHKIHDHVVPRDVTLIRNACRSNFDRILDGYETFVYASARAQNSNIEV